MKKFIGILLALCLLTFLFGADQEDWPDIYIDESVAPGGVGSEADPYSDFSEINWTTGGDNSIFDYYNNTPAASVTINLQRGETWRERLTPGGSGSATYPIIFRPYGSGANPLIMGSTDLSGAVWTEGGGTDYTADGNMVAYYYFEDAPGLDQSGTGDNHVDDASADPTQDGADYKQGTESADFELDSTQYLQCLNANLTGDFPGKAASDSFTVVAWIKAETLAARNNIASVYNTSWRFQLTAGDVAAKIHYSDAGGGDVSAAGNTTIDAGTWYHVAVVLDGTANLIYIYLDGSEDTGGGVAFDHTLATNSDNFQIGKQGTGLYYFDGKIDELAVFDRALSSAEITEIVDDGLDGSGGGAANVWYNDDLAADPTVIWLDGTSYPEAADAVSVDSTDRWFWEAGETRIHVYAASDPDGFYSTIEAPSDDYACRISNRSYIEFENIHFKYAIVIVAYIYNGTDHVEFNDCTLEGAGENCTVCLLGTEYNTFDNCLIYGDNITETNQTVWGADTDTNYMTFKNCTIRNGTHSTFIITSGSNWLVENNEIYSSSGFGRCLALSGESGEGSNIIRYNYIHDAYNGDYTAAADNQVNGEGNQLYYNIFSGGEQNGLRIYKTAPAVCIDNVFYNNIFYGFTGAGVYVSVSDGADSGNLFKNNIFMNNDSDNHYQVEYRVVGGLVLATFENNCIYDSATASTVYDAGAARTVAWMEANHGIYWGDNIIGIPRFIDAANDDFRLLMGSPCINTGTDVSLTTDYRGRSIRHAPDIGAYEDPTSALFLSRLFKYLKEKKDGK